MWQRWGTNPRPAISNPLHFTELDQDHEWEDRYLETIPEVESISSRRQSAHVVLPELPFRAVAPLVEIPQPIDPRQQGPSVATSPRDHTLRINAQVPVQEPARAEVSPLTPQDLTTHRSLRDEQPISPIEPAARLASRLPVPSRPIPNQIPRKTLKPTTENKSQAQTRWDDYSGEPTTDERGKPASTRPGTQPLELQYPHLKERTKQILAGLRERDTARGMQSGKPPVPVPVFEESSNRPSQREPWRGPSGRLPIVEPVRSVPAVRHGPYPETAENVPEAYGMYNEQTTRVTASPETPQLRSVVSEEEIRPIPPLKPGRRIRTPELVTKLPESSRSRQSPSASPDFPLAYHEVTVDRQYRAESPQHDDEPRTPDTPVLVEPPRMVEMPETPIAYESHDADREQSRFSWTTYTTSAADSSPQSLARIVRGSPPPPMPDLPPAIIIKKRPVSSSPFMHSSPYNSKAYANSEVSVARKPVPGAKVRSSSISSAASRAISMSKSLPPTPTVLEASDKIENFLAQLEALERRKHNINRIISDLQASLKKNAIIYDMWKRREVEKNITNHRMELDDVVRDIHDINLILTRAQRKRDREDGYEACTGLWIKRVTS